MCAMLSKAQSFLLLNVLALGINSSIGVRQADRPAAALIIGGYAAGTSQQGIQADVELFGCAASVNHTVAVRSFPAGVYLTGATFLQEEGSVLACGGYNCNDRLCGLTRFCWEWTPELNEWRNHSVLAKSRYGHLMVRAQELNATGSQPLSTIALGYHLDTEIYDPDLQAWKPYLSLPERVTSIDCLVQYEGKLYTINTNLTELDLDTWALTSLGPVPSSLQFPTKCSALTIDGARGIYVRYGYWFNLDARQWERKREPPYNPISVGPNAMWSFRGRPTIFGNPKCGSNATCENVEVVQYDPSADAWVSLGDMIKSRRFHEVVEVPGDFCDAFVSTTTTTTTTTKTTTTTATRTTTTTQRTTTVSSTTAGARQIWQGIATTNLILVIFYHVAHL